MKRGLTEETGEMVSGLTHEYLAHKKYFQGAEESLPGMEDMGAWEVSQI